MKKVLVVEDSEDICQLIRSTLELLELKVIDAKNGVVGVKLARECQPTLIISDIDMPLMNGYEVLKALKEDALTASIPFMFLTARIDAISRKRAFELGATAYMIKPFKIEDLLKTVAAYVA